MSTLLKKSQLRGLRKKRDSWSAKRKKENKIKSKEEDNRYRIPDKKQLCCSRPVLIGFGEPQEIKAANCESTKKNHSKRDKSKPSKNNATNQDFCETKGNNNKKIQKKSDGCEQIELNFVEPEYPESTKTNYTEPTKINNIERGDCKPSKNNPAFSQLKKNIAAFSKPKKKTPALSKPKKKTPALSKPKKKTPALSQKKKMQPVSHKSKKMAGCSKAKKKHSRPKIAQKKSGRSGAKKKSMICMREKDTESGASSKADKKPKRSKVAKNKQKPQISKTKKKIQKKEKQKLINKLMASSSELSSNF